MVNGDSTFSFNISVYTYLIVCQEFSFLLRMLFNITFGITDIVHNLTCHLKYIELKVFEINFNGFYFMLQPLVSCKIHRQYCLVTDCIVLLCTLEVASVLRNHRRCA